MYRVDMYLTIQTLLSQGKSEREIARTLGIHRRTVHKIKLKLESGHQRPDVQVRGKKLSKYEAQIEEWLAAGLSGKLIHERLTRTHGLSVGYTTVCRYLKAKKSSEVYIPVHKEAGKEVQVDFGYLGRFQDADRWVKAWVFCMVLSYSRYAYYTVVQDQRVATFLRCHQEGFEHFGGVPLEVKLDNLKAGVLSPSFYEHLLQEQYAAFLAHYGSVALPARVRRGQDKGKVEAGIKYVKGNFLGNLQTTNYQELQQALRSWNEQICNLRTHGTTRKVPKEVFEQEEREALLPLPPQRFEYYQVEERKVNRMGHITFRQNYYSVPYEYAGHTLRVESNEKVLRIFEQQNEVALHALSLGKGSYVTQEGHLPAHKRKKSKAYYLEELAQIGPHTLTFQPALEEAKPRQWVPFVRGILALRRQYASSVIGQVCRRALAYKAFSYRSVKQICEKKLYLDPPEVAPAAKLGGFGQPLAQYDQLTNP